MLEKYRKKKKKVKHEEESDEESGEEGADGEKKPKEKKEKDKAPIFPLERSDKYDILSTTNLEPIQLQYFVRDVIAEQVNKAAMGQGLVSLLLGKRRSTKRRHRK